MTLIELSNKRHEGFVLSGGQENTSIGPKLGFKLYRDATLTYVDQSLIVLAWSCTLNKIWSLSGVEQTLFLDQELDQLVSKSNWALNLESMAVLELKNLAKSLMDWNWVFSFRVPRFVAMYLSNPAESDFDSLSKVVDIA